VEELVGDHSSGNRIHLQLINPHKRNRKWIIKKGVVIKRVVQMNNPQPKEIELDCRVDLSDTNDDKVSEKEENLLKVLEE
jgi:hypothetical protein